MMATMNPKMPEIFESTTKRPVVALVGRPNVGKSRLFNRLLGKRAAIVQDLPGVTRDRQYAQATLAGRAVLLVDTGGLVPKTSDSMLQAMREQTQLAIDQADVVVMVVEIETGLCAEDAEIARQLRRASKACVLAVNKVDNDNKQNQTYEFARLGIEPAIAISAEHARHIRPLVDAIVAKLPEATLIVEDLTSTQKVLCRVAILGRPNVGKSSLVNRLLGEERHLATPIAGTTRDSIDSLITYEGETFCFVDTAGVRRKARVSETLEEFMVSSALRSLESADVVVLVLDATELATDQEAKLAALCHDRGKSLILAVNKWDKKPSQLKTEELREEVYYRLPLVNYARVIYLSAKTGYGVERLFPEIRESLLERQRRIATPELNRLLHTVLESHPPPMHRSKRGKIYYAAQIATAPPTFALQVNDPKRFTPDYLRYLTNELRTAYGFQGTPLVLRLRQRRSSTAVNATSSEARMEHSEFSDLNDHEKRG